MEHSAQRVDISCTDGDQQWASSPNSTIAALREEVSNLKRALDHSRDIGTAIGILMATRKVTREGAFDLLRQASQNSNVKLNVLALDVVDQGCLPEEAIPARLGLRQVR